MTAEKVLAGLLEAGDLIWVHHHHDPRCGECLAPWQTEAVVTSRPASVSGRLAVNWDAGTRPPGGRKAITGVSVYSPDEQVVRIGRLRPARPGALALAMGNPAGSPGVWGGTTPCLSLYAKLDPLTEPGVPKRQAFADHHRACRARRRHLRLPGQARGSGCRPNALPALEARR